MRRRRRRGLLRHLWNFVKEENLHRVLIVLGLLWVASTLSLTALEPRLPWFDWGWWSIVTLTTVGYGDITPSSMLGRGIGVVLMMVGIGILGMFTATVAGLFVENRLRKERGMGSYDLEDHIILCGWNQRAAEILAELRSDPRSQSAAIVLLAEIDSKPVEDDDLAFIQGSVNEETLKRANVAEANTVVILGDDGLDESARDAQVVLSALTVETLNSDAYTIAELVREENVRHCERARTDEVIVGSKFSSRLIASAALDHGITKVLSEILSSRVGNNLVKMPLPANLAGRAFLEVISELKKERDCIVLAVQRADSVLTNPAADFRLESGDNLVCVVQQSTRKSVQATG